MKWLGLDDKDPEIIQVAYGLMTDASYSPWLCEACPKRALAAACIIVAGDLLERDSSSFVSTGILPWYGAFGAHANDVAVSCHIFCNLSSKCGDCRKLFKDEGLNS